MFVLSEMSISIGPVGVQSIQVPRTQGGLGEHSSILVLQSVPVQPVVQLQVYVPGPVACTRMTCVCVCVFVCVCVCVFVCVCVCTGVGECLYTVYKDWYT